MMLVGGFVDSEPTGPRETRAHPTHTHEAQIQGSALNRIAQQ